MFRLFCVLSCFFFLGCGGEGTSSNTSPVQESLFNGPQEPAIVINVVDGDTVDVKLADSVARVRLLAIDTPEMKPVECYGQEATDYVTQLLVGLRSVLGLQVEWPDRWPESLRQDPARSRHALFCPDAAG